MYFGELKVHVGLIKTDDYTMHTKLTQFCVKWSILTIKNRMFFPQ
jgi:hypothetical protein